MGFFNDRTSFIVKPVSASNVLKLDETVTVAFYINDVIDSKTITSATLDIKDVPNRGATTTLFSDVVLTVVDNKCSTDVTLVSPATTSSNIQFEFKIVDEDGVEHFTILKDWEVIA